MSSAAGDVLPALPPIRTAAPPEPACSSAASSSTATAPDAESVAAAEEKRGGAGAGESAPPEPTTPTAEGSRLRPPAQCPPAPRKPACAPPPLAAKRKLPMSAASADARREFFPVARDLSAVFRALPPKKRIRAG